MGLISAIKIRGSVQNGVNRIRDVGSEATCLIRSPKSHIISCLGTYVPFLSSYMGVTV